MRRDQKRADIAVIGAGPAGLTAASAAASCGADVILIDENDAAGGQLRKQIHKFFGSSRHFAAYRGFQLADQLALQANEAEVRTLFSSRVLNIRNGRIDCIRQDRVYSLDADRIIIAAGARENPVAIPGWTLPGVVTIGALQTMMNIHRVLPGKRFVIIGSGNAGLVVAHQILQAGGEVPAIIEQGDRTGGFLVHANKVTCRGTAILTGHVVKEIRGNGKVQGVVASPREADSGEAFLIEADIVALSAGFQSSCELVQIAGGKILNTPSCSYVPATDAEAGTSVPNVYCIGDASGVREASVAMEEGRIAGIACARSLGLVGEDEAAQVVSEARHYIELITGCSSADSRKSSESSPDLPAAGSIRTRGRRLVIDCPECIPCDPCVAVCPFDAISLEHELTGRPVVNQERCRACGICIAHCPGQAIRLVDYSRSGPALVTIPHEMVPAPKTGESWETRDVRGQPVCEAEVVSVRNSREYNGTLLVTLKADWDRAGNIVALGGKK